MQDPGMDPGPRVNTATKCLLFFACSQERIPVLDIGNLHCQATSGQFSHVKSQDLNGPQVLTTPLSHLNGPFITHCRPQ